jgi:hypothetical protein
MRYCPRGKPRIVCRPRWARRGGMNTLRIFVKGLAVVVGLCGAAWAIVGPILLFVVAGGYLPARTPPPSQALLVLVSATSAAMAILGWLIMRQVWIHWRRPDRATALAVVRVAGFFLGGSLLNYANKHAPLPKPDGTWGPMIALCCTLGLVLACYLFYPLVLRRLAERAYPAPAR